MDDDSGPGNGRDISRSTAEVIDSHLVHRRDGRLGEDLGDNYTEDVVVLSHLGHFQGRDAMAKLAALLAEQLKDAEFFYDMVLVDGPYAFLQWRAVAQDMHVSNGADSFVVRDGRICMQTISYALSTKPSAPDGPIGD
ncbi:nuclear transport factor 2 family protein [Egicoccus sp. AB-alg2]|uniref:nuclear transport factor 2 family protein n=1 Tax=Egicoccus sp. AB-alg2 TaxID=3242693 RepID=UPI00359EF366